MPRYKVYFKSRRDYSAVAEVEASNADEAVGKARYRENRKNFETIGYLEYPEKDWEVDTEEEVKLVPEDEPVEQDYSTPESRAAAREHVAQMYVYAAAFCEQRGISPSEFWQHLEEFFAWREDLDLLGFKAERAPTPPDPGNDPLAALLQGTNIVEVIGASVVLTAIESTGREQWRGKCPFCQDAGEHLAVTKERGLFYCFNCHKSGNVLRFVMEKEHLPLEEAVAWLERREA